MAPADIPAQAASSGDRPGGRQFDAQVSAGQFHTQATSFGAAAAEYERGRPPYPPEAIDWLLPPGATRVADIGAGTGKLTKQLHDRGVEVIAIEPLAGMREQLWHAVPGVTVLAGTAEQIPLADGSVDAVLMAQAWHWVTPERAVPEVARVLTPGGRLGVLWNLRDERDDLVARLSTIMQSWESPDHGGHRPDFGSPFGPVERLDVEWVYRLSPDAMVDYVASRSYIITMAEQERAEVLASVRELATTHSSLDGATEVSLPQVTRCSRADLPS